MEEWAARVVVCCLVVVAGGGSLTAVTDDASARPLGVVQEGTVDETAFENYDAIQIEVRLQDNGSASWTVRYQYRLNGSESTAAWEELRADVQEDQGAYGEWFAQRWEQEAVTAERETEREMGVSGFTVETETQSGVQEHGFITVTFQWSGFAMVELNRVEAGDAINDFVLEDPMQLVIAWPEKYERSSVEPTPDDSRESAVIWNGDETDFVGDEPRIELIEQNNETPAATDDADGLSMSGIVLLAAGVVVLVGGVGWWLQQYSPAPAETDESDDETANSTPPELLSNEERVLNLIDEHGGRIKQQEVVSELGWTEAKTSQVVSGLREDDKIDVFRIGRENVLSRADAGETDSV